MTEARLGELPKKIMAAAAIVKDARGRLLMVKPTYRDYWNLPGGVVERGESPRAACAREVLEETGLSITPGRLLVLDYTDVRQKLTIDHFELIFDGGILAPDFPPVRVAPGEIADAEFVRPEQVSTRTVPWIAARVEHALTAIAYGSLAYLENQTPPNPVVRARSPDSESPAADDFYCREVLSGALSVRIEVDSHRVLAFHHTKPAYPVHIVVIPKVHVGSLCELSSMDPALIVEMMQTVAVVAKRVEQTHGACRIISNMGDYQDTKHLHWHVVSGKPQLS